MPGGRPSDINKLITIDDDGNQLTVGQHIARSMRSGSYLEPAAAAAGQGKETVYGWLRIAGQLRIRAAGTDPHALALSDHERACLEFSDAYTRACAEWELAANLLLEREGRGGYEIVTTTVKETTDGKTETTTKTETARANVDVIMWRLTRRFPERYRERLAVDSGTGGALSDEERATALVANIRDRQATQATKRRHRPRARKEAAGGTPSA